MITKTRTTIYNDEQNELARSGEEYFGPEDGRLPAYPAKIQAQQANADAGQAQRTADYAKKLAKEGSATRYITDTTDGIWLTPENAKPNQDGTPNVNTSGWRLRDAMELFRKGISVIKSWYEEPPEEDDGEVYGAKMRIGQASSSHIETNEGGLDFYAETDGTVKLVFSMNTDGDGVPSFESYDEMFIYADELHLPDTDIAVEEYSDLYNALIGIDWPSRSRVNLQDILAYILTHM
jgi:hypothetical protein